MSLFNRGDRWRYDIRRQPCASDQVEPRVNNQVSSSGDVAADVFTGRRVDLPLAEVNHPTNVLEGIDAE